MVRITLHPSTPSSSFAKRISQSITTRHNEGTEWYTIPVKGTYPTYNSYYVIPTSNALSGVKHANTILYQLYSGPTLTDHIRWVRPRPLDHALLYVGLCSDLT